jgi:hypothetical protein
MTDNHAESNTPAELCEVCGAPMTLIPYQDAAGCGTAIIELWRCENGHARYGNTIDYAACDIDSGDN